MPRSQAMVIIVKKFLTDRIPPRMRMVARDVINFLEEQVLIYTDRKT